MKDNKKVKKNEIVQIVSENENTIEKINPDQNKKHGSSNKFIFPMIMELVLSAIGIAWFILPLFVIDGKPVVTYSLPFLLYDKISFDITGLNFQKLYELFLFVISNILYLIYLIPVISVFKFPAIFLRKKVPFLCQSNKMIPIVLNIINSFLILLTFFQYVQIYADKLVFFKSISILNYVLNSAVLFLNVGFVFYMVRSINKKSKTYKGYLNLLENIKRFSDRNDKKLLVSIRAKLIVSFISIFLMVILVLSYTLMKDYKDTILKAIEYNGKTIADQSASFFKENFHDYINMNFYLKEQADKNNQSDLKFQSVSFYKKQGKEEKYAVESSTDPNLIGSFLTDQEMEAYKHSGMIYNDEAKIYSFIAPVNISDKTIGFSSVAYQKDVIYESYFRTQIRIVIFVLIFLYAAIILVYMIGSRIALPILFLSTNVRKLSFHLTKMIRGEEKVSANSLIFDDMVTSRDEIKTLSLEIDEMVTVMKGIIPYVSASTLMHADKKGAKSMEKNMTFLFTDIRGFTTMCEGMRPDKVVEILNSYLDLQTEIVLANNGDIDKFVGDELMATFDGPNKEFNACMASIQLRDAMEKERQERLKKNMSTINIGIGINTGPVVFGSVGARDRMDFTSIGDTVNLAARLESANKEYQTKTLISEAVYKKIFDKFLCRQIDLVTVKGKTQPVKIYEIMALKEKGSNQAKSLVKNFEQGLIQYRKKEWDKALEMFLANIKQYDDEPSKIFYNRIKHFKKNPPPEKWNGVFTMNVYSKADTIPIK